MIIADELKYYYAFFIFFFNARLEIKIIDGRRSSLYSLNKYG